MSTFSAAIARLKSFYNSLAYNSTSNPGGMDNNGHKTNFIPSLQDVGIAGQGCAEYALMAQAAAQQAGAWIQPVEADGETLATVAYLSPTQFTVTGPESQAANFIAKRAIKVLQVTPGTGYVSSSAYDAETGLTTVSLAGIALDAGLTEVWFGQDPTNAPQPPDDPVGSDLYLYETCSGL